MRKDVFKNSLALTATLVVAALVLTGVYNWISPIMEISAEKHRVEEFFPGYNFEKVGLGHNPITLVVYDSAGEEKGYVVENSTDGYGGSIRYYMGIDNEGRIKGINIIEHAETVGLGDIIKSESFQEQFIGKHYDDTIASEVDTVSGATVSTQSMIASIQSTLDKTVKDFLGVEEEEVKLAEIPDGSYYGTATGQMGSIEVEVTVENESIQNIEIVEHEETPDYFAEVKEEVPQRIKSEQKLEVDTVSGATGSSEGIKDAVEDALNEAVEDVETEEKTTN